MKGQKITNNFFMDIFFIIAILVVVTTVFAYINTEF